MDEPPLIHEQPLPYVAQLGLRDTRAIDLLVIHCTELPTLAMAREFGERIVHPSGTGNSGHFYIDRDGSIWRWVPEDRVAHHVRDRNQRSIGIELVNAGRYPDWFDSRQQRMVEPYPDAQIDALLELMADLRRRAPNLRALAGHEDLDTATVAASDDPVRRVRRKLDPGPLFPWTRVIRAGTLARMAVAAQPV